MTRIGFECGQPDSRDPTLFSFFFVNMECFKICMSSLHGGHAILLCIVPVLVYVLPKQALEIPFSIPGSLQSTCGGRVTYRVIRVHQTKGMVLGLSV